MSGFNQLSIYMRTDKSLSLSLSPPEPGDIELYNDVMTFQCVVNMGCVAAASLLQSYVSTISEEVYRLVLQAASSRIQGSFSPFSEDKLPFTHSPLYLR